MNDTCDSSLAAPVIFGLEDQTVKEKCMEEKITKSNENVPDSMKMNEKILYQDIPLDDDRNIEVLNAVKYSHRQSIDSYDEDVLYNHSYQENYENTEVFDSRLQELENEQEQLNSSLISLTSHFAQVQLRLKQIVAASDDEKEALLKELEEFAFRGIPELKEPPKMDLLEDGNNGAEDEDADQRWMEQRKKQKELINKLKEQLLDLEQYAYETGELNSVPSAVLLERQSVVIEQLKSRLSLNLEVMDKLGPEELRKHVDQAIRDLMNPVIMREQLVDQLKTQVTDLERYIQYLHTKQGGLRCIKDSNGACTCDCPIHGNNQTGVQNYDAFVAQERKRKGSSGPGVKYGSEYSGNEAEDAARIMKRVMTLLQMITFAQFGGCANTGNVGKNRGNFGKNRGKSPNDEIQYEDIRKKLDLAIENILEIKAEKMANDSDYTSDSDDNVFVAGNVRSEKMTAAVRKDLAPALKELLEHGIVQIASENRSLIVSHLLDWTCFSTRNNDSSSPRKMTAWDLLVRYYHFKNGDSYSSCPARRLSQSFNLQMIGGNSISPKQSLLTTIYDIIESHTPLKRSADSHFKAFVSRALNEGKLIPWLRLIVKNRTIVETLYEPWSYTVSTGWDDALQSLEKLNGIKFDVPIDLAVRQLKNISEAF